ncbi:hypothetical protein BDW74DRAFT_8310 [Aspergillus multicolor]|uniref:Zn(II)2Cys6 transcription factor n=1 Tax=Aspergillus multicolor TaxID=41759 RepID=UPI003CCE3DA0
MVRTTIACERCRLSKVKCIHNGSPPCRGCVKASKTAPGQCVLARPQLKRRRCRDGARKADVEESFSVAMEPPKTHAERVGSPLSEAHTEAPIVRPSKPLLADLMQTATVFVHKFRELGFLHRPTFSSDLKRGDSKARLLGSALTRLFSTASPGDLQDDPPLISLAEPPNLYIVQTLLVISMAEWGRGNIQMAWMYGGAAIRMMQLLEVSTEIHNRTFWSCFIMDRLVFSGIHQPLCLPLDTVNTHWPVPDTDYALGNANVTHHLVIDPFPMTLDYSYAILVQGFEIWARIHNWVVSGGRRRKDMLLDDNLPWKERSSWMTMRRQLQEWRDAQELPLQYPTSPASIATSLEKGEVFGYINLIYFVSILFLTREYIPFLPWPTSTPIGPVDPPLLPAQAPDEWWSSQALELFKAAACITRILDDLEDEGAALKTPFAAFCNFSAATMNIYVSCFPSMNLGRSGDMTAIVDRNLAYLDKFRTTWRIGEGWWTTVQRTKSLYERHARQPERYLGKTRDDFVELEASIHGVAEPDKHDNATGRSEPQEMPPENVDELDWAIEWPLWSELHSMHWESI